jgi:hypothetical protein
MRVSRRFTAITGTALRRTLAGGIAAATLATASAGAQAFSPTGTHVSGGLDQSWSVSCTTVGSFGQPACPATGFTPATVVTATPAGWQTVPTTDGAHYISVNSSATIWNGTPNEDPHYQYVFQTTFDTPSSATAIGFNMFAFDNYWVGGTLNGHAISINPTPLGPDGGNWTSLFNLTAADGLNAGGPNTLELTVQGNGRTDGILVDGYTTTPEPGSLALLGTGLFGLVPMIRRKKQK